MIQIKSGDNNINIFQLTVIMLKMRTGFPRVCIRLQIEAGIRAVLTAEAVATGGVNKYFDSANFGTSPVRSPRANLHSENRGLEGCVVSLGS